MVPELHRRALLSLPAGSTAVGKETVECIKSLEPALPRLAEEAFWSSCQHPWYPWSFGWNSISPWNINDPKAALRRFSVLREVIENCQS